MADFVSATLTGITLGLAAGLAPGPLMTLVITQTMRHGFKEGLLVAASPLVTDIPIVLTLFFILRELPDQVLGVLGMAGAIYALFLAYETAKADSVGDVSSASTPASLRKGVIANFLSPHPYLFWITVGVPYVLAASERSAIAPWGFIVGLYFLLVGSKVGVAALVGQYRTLLTGRAYPYVMRGLAVALVVFAFLLFQEGLSLITNSEH
ncbi:LysE family transporter [Shimia sp. R9_3]|uniref:LysE family translocator n=1 Tax=Shimia sp. R9_3 TaxID=2821113 RepID=UPI001ADD4594|nr:LysE family transporter [Shimia sp. R9_3]MBO9399947.1 LysE family transporter [Shimia sp. R9_3]